MKRYNPVIITDTDDLMGNIRAMMQIEENGGWFKVKDVVELVERVLNTIGRDNEDTGISNGKRGE